MPEYSPEIWAAICLGLLAGGFVKGASGVGLPLVAVPILALATDLAFAVSLMPVGLIVTNLWQCYSSGRIMAALKRFWTLLLMVPVGIAIGITALIGLPTDLLMGSVGLVVLMLATLMLAQPDWHIPPRWERVLSPLIGLVSGTLGGVAAIPGPPNHLYLLMVGAAKDLFVAAIGLIHLLAGIALMIGLSRTDVIDGAAWWLPLLALAPMMAGLLIGERVRARLNQKRFRQLIIAILILSGLTLIRRGWF